MESDNAKFKDGFNNQRQEIFCYLQILTF